jgi:hypothetical protein
MLAAALLLAGEPNHYAVSLAWKPSPDYRTTGYVMLWGTNSGEYCWSLDVGLTNEVAVTELECGLTYYFAVYAYGEGSLQSELSNEVSFNQPHAPRNLRLSPTE